MTAKLILIRKQRKNFFCLYYRNAYQHPQDTAVLEDVKPTGRRFPNLKTLQSRLTTKYMKTVSGEGN